MLNKAIIFTALMAVTTVSFAASEIRDSQMADMKTKVGNISVNVRNGTFEEAMTALNEKADEKGATYYRITSLGRSGMSSDVSATAVIYK